MEEAYNNLKKQYDYLEMANELSTEYARWSDYANELTYPGYIKALDEIKRYREIIEQVNKYLSELQKDKVKTDYNITV